LLFVVLTSSVKGRLDRMIASKKDVEQLFENQFMANYPNKTGKKAALVSFSKISFNDSTNVLQDILDGIENRKDWIKKAPSKEFIPSWPMPSTYLNGERWKDVLEPWTVVNGEENSITYKPQKQEKVLILVLMELALCLLNNQTTKNQFIKIYSLNKTLI
jgi:hypothetical protein